MKACRLHKHPLTLLQTASCSPVPHTLPLFGSNSYFSIDGALNPSKLNSSCSELSFKMPAPTPPPSHTSQPQRVSSKRLIVR